MVKIRAHGDGGLWYDKSKKLYRATVEIGSDAQGKRLTREVTSKTKTGARDKADAIRDEVARYGAPLGKRVKVADWSRRWLDVHARDIDPKTRAGYAALVNGWIIPTIGPKMLATLKPSDVVAVRAAMSAAGRATSTQRQAQIVLGLMLEAARLENLCRGNVAKDAPMPGARRAVVVKAERGAFTTEQTIAILATAAEMDPATASRWWFKVMTGARQTEILGATLADLHLGTPAIDGEPEGRSYYVVNWKLEELSRDHGCDGTCDKKRGSDCTEPVWRVPDDFEMTQLDGRWHLTRPKSRTGRVVPLIPQMAQALRLHLESSKDMPNPHGLLWHDGGRPITPRDDAQAWRDLLVAAKIIAAKDAVAGGTAMTGHWARHTAVTVLMELTHGDAQLVGEIVGHSSSEVTEMYRHARAEESQAAMDALGKAWGGALRQIEA